MLWALHLGYLWLSIGLIVRGLALLGIYAMPEIDTLHGITIGALGTLSLAMMTRVAQGHSGVPIQSNAALTLMFVLPTAKTSEERAAARGQPFNAQELVDQTKRRYSELKEGHDRWRANCASSQSRSRSTLSLSRPPCGIVNRFAVRRWHRGHVRK